MHEAAIVPRRSPIRSLAGVQVVGTGSYVPDNIVTNEDLASHGFDADWIVQRTGIRERRCAPEGMATSDMATMAAERCLKKAGITGADVDLVILGTFTPDLPMPATACLVQDRLGINGPAFDIQAACAGFIYSLVTAMQFVAAGTSKYALVIGADTNTRVANPNDKKTYPLFGDGAGAVLLTAGSEKQGLVSYTIGSDGSGADLLCRKMGGSRIPNSNDGLQDNLQYLHMNGRPVFKWAIRLIEDTIRDVLSGAKAELSDVDLFVMHQANERIIYAAADNLGVPRDKVPINLDLYGNTSAGSIPIVLDEAFEAGRIEQDSRIILTGFGGGLAWGTALLHW